MNIVPTLRTELKEAMVSKNTMKRGLLRLILSEIAVLESKSKPNDMMGVQVVRKLMKSNETSMNCLKPEDKRFKSLQEENEYLATFVKGIMTPETIMTHLTEVADEIKKNPARGVGVAAKFLKEKGITGWLGDDLQPAVKLVCEG